mgnify:CR=1 FL=1
MIPFAATQILALLESIRLLEVFVTSPRGLYSDIKMLRESLPLPEEGSFSTTAIGERGLDARDLSNDSCQMVLDTISHVRTSLAILEHPITDGTSALSHEWITQAHKVISHVERSLLREIRAETAAKVKGLYVIELERPEMDERGFFTRIWDKKIFEDKGLNSDLVQISFSFNKTRGTIRGMHFQKKPFAEVKLVRCTRGKIFDVIIDLRAKSNTFMKWISVELNSDNLKMLYIPEGFAHGFQTLEDNTEVSYQMTQYYMPEFAEGIRWDDTQFNIDWPIKFPILSEKDKKYSDFDSGNFQNE